MNKLLSWRNLALASVLTGALGGSFWIGQVSAENQPQMRASLEYLRLARNELRTATPDKGGYRKAALRSIDSAIDQVQKGITFDNRDGSRRR